MPSSHLSAASASARHDDGKRSAQSMIMSFLDATYIFVFRTASVVIRRALFDIIVSEAEVESVAKRRRVSLRRPPIDGRLLVGSCRFVEKADTNTNWSKNMSVNVIRRATLCDNDRFSRMICLFPSEFFFLEFVFRNSYVVSCEHEKSSVADPFSPSTCNQRRNEMRLWRNPPQNQQRVSDLYQSNHAHRNPQRCGRCHLEA